MPNKPSISTKDMPREDWLEHRRVGIGGSDVGAILGLSKWKTPLQVWEEKKGIAKPFEGNDATRRGNLLEAHVCEDWAALNKREIRMDPTMYFHPKHDILLANVDRIIVDNGDGQGDGLLEAKTAGEWAYKAWDNQIPVYYYVQLQHYLNVLGLKWGEFATWILGFAIDADSLPIVRDDKLIDDITNELMEWWMSHIVKDIPPAMMEPDTALAKSISGSSVEATPEMLAICNELRDAKVATKAAKDVQDGLEGKVKVYMQDTETLVHGEMPLATYKTGNSFNQEALEAEQSMIVSRFTEPTFNKSKFQLEEKRLYKQYMTGKGSRRFNLKLK